MDSTYGRQIDKYDRRAHLVIYVTSGLGGIALFGAGDLGNGLFASVPAVFRAVFLTMALVSGALLGLSYAGFTWARTQLARAIDDGEVNAHDAFDREQHSPPQRAEMQYRIATILVPTTGTWLLLVAWLACLP